MFQEQRLRQRNTETEESLAKRLAAAQVDMESSECGRQRPPSPRLLMKHGSPWGGGPMPTCVLPPPPPYTPHRQGAGPV